MRIVPNPVLVRFSRSDAPTKWISKQAKAMFEAGLEGEDEGSWSDRGLGGNVLTAASPKSDNVSPWGTPTEVAEERARAEIKRLRLLADAWEQILGVYGSEAFAVSREAERPSRFRRGYEAGFLSIMRERPTDIWVNGRHFKRDRGGNYKRFEQ